MEWYQIVLIIIGYILISVPAGFFIAEIEDDESLAMLGLLWPISLPMFILELSYITWKSRKNKQNERQDKHTA